MITKKSFYYIRHGKTDWNQQGLMQGQADIPLNVTAIEQAYAAQKYFEKIKIDRICYSPLSRAKQTAEIINEKLQVPLIEIDQLKECYLGSYEGKRSGEPWIDKWKQGVIHDGKMEKYPDYLARIVKGINEALSHGENTLIVGHGLVHWALLDALKFNGELFIENCIPVYHQATEGPWLIISADGSDTEKFD